jgi:hypothetical protein
MNVYERFINIIKFINNMRSQNALMNRNKEREGEREGERDT